MLSPDKGAAAASEDFTATAVKDALQPMGWTSENVAEDFNISRDDMDSFAAMSFQRAEAAERGQFAYLVQTPIHKLKLVIISWHLRERAHSIHREPY